MSHTPPLTIAEACAALRAGTLTSVELTSTCLRRIAASQDSLGAFVTVCSEQALESAAVADERRAEGIDAGPLMGIPLAIKDLVATKDAPTTANSKILDGNWGGGRDAPVVARLRAAGSVILGKATTSEFAYGPPDPTSGFLIPRNPWDVGRTPGGSSSGTGVAVAAGLALGGVGTDTAGSVRAPAAANGHSGLKVTFGRVPKNGVVPLSYSLDTVGPMARSAYDCGVLLEVMAAYDEGDPCASRVHVPRYTDELTGSIDELRIGLPIPYFFDSAELDTDTRTAVLAAAELLRQSGATVTETVVPYAREAKQANSLIMLAEAFAFHHDNLIDRWIEYGPRTRTLLALGALTSSADYVQAQRLRSLFRREMAQLLSDFDVLLTPGALGPAELAIDVNMEHRLLNPSFTQQWNFAGLPAIVVPCGASSAGLPLALQIVGRPFAEATILRVADVYQRLTQWHLRAPQVAALVGVDSVADSL